MNASLFNSKNILEIKKLKRVAKYLRSGKLQTISMASSNYNFFIGLTKVLTRSIINYAIIHEAATKI